MRHPQRKVKLRRPFHHLSATEMQVWYDTVTMIRHSKQPKRLYLPKPRFIGELEEYV